MMSIRNDKVVRVLILSRPDDIHALAVDWALKSKGVDSRIWMGSDFPSLQTTTLRVDRVLEKESTWSLKGANFVLCSDWRPQVVWNRRPTLPSIPPDATHALDRSVAQQECNAAFAALGRFVSDGSIIIDPAETYLWAAHKPVQLREAKSAGFTVPDTLVTNDLQELRAFAQAHKDPLIYKAFHPVVWQQRASGLRVNLLTSLLSEEHLALLDPISLRYCPGIFQPRIPKDSELRITIMGSTVFGLRIFSQHSEKTAVDWRADAAIVDTPAEVFQVSDPLKEKCLSLMRRLHLRFGCMDLIETPAGETVFLEVNPAGQFLWKESRFPEMRLLDAFSEFLRHPIAGFDYKLREPVSSFSVFLGDHQLQEQIAQREAHHVKPENPWIAIEN